MSKSTASCVSEPSYEDLVQSNSLLKQELELFKFKFEQLQKYVFGKKSEKQFLASLPSS